MATPQRLRYIGAIDEIDAVGVGTFKRGDEFEVDADVAKQLLTQPDMYEAVTTKKKG